MLLSPWRSSSPTHEACSSSPRSSRYTPRPRLPMTIRSSLLRRLPSKTAPSPVPKKRSPSWQTSSPPFLHKAACKRNRLASRSRTHCSTTKIRSRRSTRCSSRSKRADPVTIRASLDHPLSCMSSWSAGEGHWRGFCSVGMVPTMKKKCSLAPYLFLAPALVVIATLWCTQS